ncbi:MAG: CotH kinase family protein [Spirochaetales bacterium]|nr:CotH kinase family protein [Candidatus Physcosoma equi]
MTRYCFLLLAFLFLLVGCSENTPVPPIPEEQPRFTYDIVKASGFPVVSIHLEDRNATITKTEKLPATIRVQWEGQEDQEFSSPITIKGRGNSTWDLMRKKSYTISFDSKTEILGMAKSKKWVLIANHTDKSLMRNLYASYLGNTIYSREWNPSFRVVELFLSGSYKGTYILGESIKIDKKRVNIPDVSEPLSEWKDANGDGIVDLYDGGFLLEINERMDEKRNFRSTHGVAFSLKDPDEVSEEVFSHIKGIVDNTEAALFGPNFQDTETGYASVLDVDSLVDWYLMNEFAKNKDAKFFSSVYLYYSPSDGRLHMGPNWDFDIAYGNVAGTPAADSEGFWILDTPWFSRLFEDPAFVEKVQTRWNETKTDLLLSITDWIPSMEEFLTPTANLNFSRWKILGSPVWPFASGYSKRKTYSSEVAFLQTWLLDRYIWFDEAINKL